MCLWCPLVDHSANNVISSEFRCCGCVTSEFSLVMGKKTVMSVWCLLIALKYTCIWISDPEKLLLKGQNGKIKAVWGDKISSSNCCTAISARLHWRQRSGQKRYVTVSPAHTRPRTCMCSCLRNLPFLRFYWGKGRRKGTLLIPHPSCPPSFNLLNHKWIVLSWFSVKGGPLLWDATWVVFHQAPDQGGLSGLKTLCKSTKIGPQIPGRKGCWWGTGCANYLVLKQNWLWRERTINRQKSVPTIHLVWVHFECLKLG